MEFGLDELRTGLRPGSCRFELCRHVEIARILVADRFAAGLSQHPLRYPGCRPGRRPAANWNLASRTIQRVSRSATSLGPVRDQDSVMEFALYTAHAWYRGTKSQKLHSGTACCSLLPEKFVFSQFMLETVIVTRYVKCILLSR